MPNHRDGKRWCFGLVKILLGGEGGGGLEPHKIWGGGCGKGHQGAQAYFLNANA